MSRSGNRPSPPHRTGGGAGNGGNDGIPVANSVSLDGSELALSSQGPGQGQGLGQLSPADQVGITHSVAPFLTVFIIPL